MATSTKTTAEIRKLVLLSETSRIELGRSHARLRDRLDFSGRVKDHIGSEPTKWIGASAVLGFLLSALFKSKKKPAPAPSPSPTRARVETVKKERNALVGVVAILLAVAKPVARIYATKFLKNYLKKHVRTKYLSGSRGTGVRPY